MTPQEFINNYSSCFGESAPLPLAVVYSESPLGEEKKVPGCMFKQFHRAYNGEIVTLSSDSFTCGGGKLYAGLGPTPPKVYNFVSLVEKYKQDPFTAKESIDLIDARISEKPYLNIVRIDKLDSFDDMEGLMFFISPDILSGLFTWANYDSTDINAVQSPWGSGFSETITSLVNENRRGGKHCFIGMLDVSARPYFKSDILSFSIPKSRFMEMCATLSRCCVAGAPAWLKVKKRINSKMITSDQNFRL